MPRQRGQPKSSLSPLEGGRNLTQLFKALFTTVIASLAIANEADEVILNEAGEDIASENEVFLAQSHQAARLGGSKVAITHSTGGYSV